MPPVQRHLSSCCELFVTSYHARCESSGCIRSLGVPSCEAHTSGFPAARREPGFCGAERAAWWELTLLAAHAHPSVAAMARTLLAGTTVLYDGDPLRNLTLAAFLDKFVQKKPKV